MGETLTADTSAIDDQDELENAEFSYQWLADDAEIQGAIDSTYTLVVADVGKTVKVRVSFTDEGGNQETLTSAATAAVAAYLDGPPSAPREVKVKAGDTELRVSWLPPAEEIKAPVEQYQILYGEEGGTEQELHTTQLSQVIGNLKNDVTYLVQVTAKNAAGYGTPSDEMRETPDTAPLWSADMLVKEYTSVSIGANSADLFSNVGGSASLQVKSLWSYTPDRDPRLTFEEVVPGAAALTLQVGDLALAFPEGSSGQDRFKWTDVDVDWEDGQTISVRIVPTSAAVAAKPNTPATGKPTVRGTAQVGETLTADTSGIDDQDDLENAGFSYQWLREHGGTDTDIQGETASTYTLEADDLGKTVKVRVSFTDDAGNPETLTGAATAAVAPPNTPATGARTISGDLQAGRTLTADTAAIADRDGLDQATFTYQWIANDGTTDTEIPNATDAAHTLADADVGQTIKVRVNFTDDAGNTEALSSAATAAVATEAIWEAMLTVGQDGTNYGYSRSVSMGDISAKGFSLDGVEYEVRVVAIGDGDDGLLYFSLDRALPTGFALHLGSGESRLVSADATVLKNDWVYVYQWSKGAVSWTEDEVVFVGLTRAADGPSSSGGGYSDAPLLTASFQSGTAPSAHGGAGQVFTVRVEFSEAVAVSYKTLRDDALEVSNGTARKFRRVDGHSDLWEIHAGPASNAAVTLRLPATTHCNAADAVCTADGKKLSNAVSLSIPGPGGPTISGTAQVGETLTADVSDIDDEEGLANAEFSYQWVRNDGTTDTDIQGETSSTYTLTDDDVGKAIKVRVSFTDDRGNEETLTSAATTAVAARPNAPATGSRLSVVRPRWERH